MGVSLGPCGERATRFQAAIRPLVAEVNAMTDRDPEYALAHLRHQHDDRGAIW